MQPQPPASTKYLSISQELTLSQHYAHYSVLTGLPLRSQHVKELYFELTVRPCESIRLLSEDNKTIARLSIGELEVLVRAVKDPQDFDFERGAYRNYLVASLVYRQEMEQEIGRKQIRLSTWTSLLVTIEKTIDFDQDSKWKMEDCVPVLEIGHNRKTKCFNCKIRQVSLANNKSIKEELSLQSEARYLEDGPLDTIPRNPVPSCDDLPAYASPTPVRNRLYLCHDMMGGYQQDTNRHHPYPSLKNRLSLDQKFQHTYRSLHLPQAEIFNYFSHHLISVPPQHWRRQCKATGTLCLGTFIVEGQNPGEHEYLSQQTVKLLIFLCRKYRFDGYLINIEWTVKNVDKLLIPWLRKLVREIHQAVPGSQVVWYDSVVKIGKVAYQNELNELNRIFYQTCDAIFLNYWWNEQKLANSLNLAESQKPIYVGSDCFGRNTYGGGGFSTHKAISTIRKVDPDSQFLAPALFAMGYTYEVKDGKNAEMWKINEKSLYRGLQVEKFHLPNLLWGYARPGVQGHIWQEQDGWMVTSSQPCKRKYSSQLNGLVEVWQQYQGFIISFFTTVRGTGPKFDDYYKVTMKISLANVVMHETTTGDRIASEEEEQIQLKLYIEKDLVKPETVVTIIEQGHDAEKWAGNYGSRFKNDHICIAKYSREEDWVARVKTNFSNGVAVPYLTNYNLGQGKKFYLQGRETNRNYDSMSDADPNYTYLMNPPLHVNIHFDDAYTGGTSLMAEGLAKLKLIEIDLSSASSGALRCRVAVKTLGQEIPYYLSYKLKAETKQGFKPLQEKTTNSWRILTFDIDVSKKEPNDKLILYLETKTQACAFLVGETAVYEPSSTVAAPEIGSLELEVSENNPPVFPLFCNATLKMKSRGKIMLEFGQDFVCFGWADELNDYQIVIKNIYSRSPKPNSNEITISGLYNDLSFQQIFKANVRMKQLALQSRLKLI